MLVDDYDLVAPARPATRWLPLLDYLAQGRDIGLHLVLTRRSGGAGRALLRPGDPAAEGDRHARAGAVRRAGRGRAARRRCARPRSRRAGAPWSTGAGARGWSSWPGCRRRDRRGVVTPGPVAGCPCRWGRPACGWRSSGTAARGPSSSPTANRPGSAVAAVRELFGSALTELLLVHPTRWPPDRVACWVAAHAAVAASVRPVPAAVAAARHARCAGGGPLAVLDVGAGGTEATLLAADGRVLGLPDRPGRWRAPRRRGRGAARSPGAATPPAHGGSGKPCRWCRAARGCRPTNSAPRWPPARAAVAPLAEVRRGGRSGPPGAARRRGGPGPRCSPSASNAPRVSRRSRWPHGRIPPPCSARSCPPHAGSGGRARARGESAGRATAGGGRSRRGGPAAAARAAALPAAAVAATGTASRSVRPRHRRRPSDRPGARRAREYGYRVGVPAGWEHTGGLPERRRGLLTRIGAPRGSDLIAVERTPLGYDAGAEPERAAAELRAAFDAAVATGPRLSGYDPAPVAGRPVTTVPPASRPTRTVVEWYVVLDGDAQRPSGAGTRGRRGRGAGGVRRRRRVGAGAGAGFAPRTRSAEFRPRRPAAVPPCRHDVAGHRTRKGGDGMTSTVSVRRPRRWQRAAQHVFTVNDSVQGDLATLRPGWCRSPGVARRGGRRVRPLMARWDTDAESLSDALRRHRPGHRAPA